MADKRKIGTEFGDISTKDGRLTTFTGTEYNANDFGKMADERLNAEFQGPVDNSIPPVFGKDTERTAKNIRLRDAEGWIRATAIEQLHSPNSGKVPGMLGQTNAAIKACIEEGSISGKQDMADVINRIIAEVGAEFKHKADAKQYKQDVARLKQIGVVMLATFGTLAAFGLAMDVMPPDIIK